MNTLFTLQDKETGTVIDTFTSYEEAFGAMSVAEQEDKENGTYTADFYQIATINT